MALNLLSSLPFPGLAARILFSDGRTLPQLVYSCSWLLQALLDIYSNLGTVFNIVARPCALTLLLLLQASWRYVTAFLESTLEGVEVNWCVHCTYVYLRGWLVGLLHDCFCR